MPELPTDTAALSLPEIRNWLVERVAFYLEVAPDSVDPDVGLVEMGLDSVYAMTLSGDVEEHFGLELEPTIAWDYGTVTKLADFLSAELGNR
jgi:acyl carrier protein